MDVTGSGQRNKTDRDGDQIKISPTSYMHQQQPQLQPNNLPGRQLDNYNLTTWTSKKDKQNKKKKAMAPPRRKVLATAEETLTPPDTLAEGQTIARIIKATGNSIYSIELPSKETVLVELPARFRSTIWMKRGSYVVVDTNALEDRDNKLHGEIVNIVRDEKAWRKARFWWVILRLKNKEESGWLMLIDWLMCRPKEFTKQPVAKTTSLDSDDEDENAMVGRMPSSDESDA